MHPRSRRNLGDTTRPAGCRAAQAPGGYADLALQADGRPGVPHCVIPGLLSGLETSLEVPDRCLSGAEQLLPCLGRSRARLTLDHQLLSGLVWDSCWLKRRHRDQTSAGNVLSRTCKYRLPPMTRLFSLGHTARLAVSFPPLTPAHLHLALLPRLMVKGQDRTRLIGLQNCDSFHQACDAGQWLPSDGPSSWTLQGDGRRRQPLHMGTPWSSRSSRLASPFLTSAAIMTGFPFMVTRDPRTST